jgi:hypothetical protein
LGGNGNSGIPYRPDRIYKNEWKGMGDWLGTGRIANRNREYWPYPKAREYVHLLGLKNAEEWHSYCASEKKPKYIPSNPNLVYNNLNESII